MCTAVSSLIFSLIAEQIRMSKPIIEYKQSILHITVLEIVKFYTVVKKNFITDVSDFSPSSE